MLIYLIRAYFTHLWTLLLQKKSLPLEETLIITLRKLVIKIRLLLDHIMWCDTVNSIGFKPFAIIVIKLNSQSDVVTTGRERGQLIYWLLIVSSWLGWEVQFPFQLVKGSNKVWGKGGVTTASIGVSVIPGGVSRGKDKQTGGDGHLTLWGEGGDHVGLRSESPNVFYWSTLHDKWTDLC